MNSDNDVILFHIRRHPAGLIYTYILTLVGVGAAVGMTLWLSRDMFDLTTSQLAMVSFGLVILGVIVVLLLLIQTVIYWSNTLTLTDDEVKQTLQMTLFNKKMSRLGLANVEDVTVDQKGVLAHLFGYGTLRIETAGEQSNFNFSYCSAPDKCLKKVMDAREAYLENEGNSTRRADIMR